MERRYRFTLLILLLLSISVGYAFLTQNLNITGVATLNNPSWDIHFENVQVKEGSVTASTPAIDVNRTTVTYSVNLDLPGDYYEFTVDAVNDGSIDGMITLLTSTLNGNPLTSNNMPSYLEYSVTYVDDIPIEQYQLLEAGGSETYKVRVGFKKDITESDLPGTQQTLNLSFGVTYQQSDENATVISRPTIKEYTSSSKTEFKADTYRENIKIVNIGTTISPPANVIASWDIGVDQNGNVMAYITENQEDNTKYDLYIQGDGRLYANETSSYLFYNLRGVERINNLNLLNTINVKKMYGMFNYTGYNSSTFSIDVSSFNTSNVEQMGSMFSNAGYNASTWSIGDISRWDTSKVTNLQTTFSGAGYKASTFNIDLTNWNTASVKTMMGTFKDAGYWATTWSIGDLSGWNTSKVTSMSETFYNAGYKAQTWNVGTLSGWNTALVTTMGNMFRCAGYTTTQTFSIDISSWNTPLVTTMSGMFQAAGYNASKFSIGDLSGWNAPLADNMTSMFSGAGYKATTWNSIGTLKIYATKIQDMFRDCKNATVLLKVYKNPTTYSTAFRNASTESGSGIIVDYTSVVTNIDNIIATKSSGSNVVKGSLIAAS